MVKGTSLKANAADFASVEAVATLALGEATGTLSLTIRVTPRASRDTLTIEDGQLRIRLRAAPVDGAANAALIALLAERLRLPRRAITIVQGDTARVKRLAITGLTADIFRQRLAQALG
jgi:uncharacterized protein YggU (UPF0235/DUF167 family)